MGIPGYVGEENQDSISGQDGFRWYSRQPSASAGDKGSNSAAVLRFRAANPWPTAYPAHIDNSSSSVYVERGADLFVSNQDTNVVAGFSVPSAGYPAMALTVAPYLTSTFPSGGTFYDGTYVASAQPVTKGSQTPPAVPVANGGLSMTGFPPHSEPAVIDAAQAPAKHSVRGILFAGGVLYVADEAGARVAMYDPATGAYAGALEATTDGTYTFSTPVGLAVNPVSGHVYIGDPGNDAIFSYHPSSKNVKVEVDKKSAGDAVEKVSGLAVAADGTLFFGSRRALASAAQASLAQSTSTYAISTYANGKVATFAAGLTDTPECLLIVPA